MTTEAISSGQTSVQAELRRTANTRKYFKYKSCFHTLVPHVLNLQFPCSSLLVAHTGSDLSLSEWAEAVALVMFMLL